ncbi:MAG: aminodeoxychorismate/anthranilate synthase component II [Pseudomonadota bacterium]
MTQQILVIDNYDSFTWNLVHYLHDVGADTEVVRNDALTTDEALAQGADGVLLSPGPCTPNEAGICMDVVKKAPAGLPILGVCLGHQAIGQALGGTVVTAKEIRHGKISTIRTSKQGLFEDLPEQFDVVRYHSLSVLSSAMPQSLRTDATTPDGDVMAVRHVTRPVYGLQFHPESIATDHGHTILENWLGVFAG